MKIGLFSDSYLPSMDGISYSIEIFRQNLAARGHDVTVFAPSPNIRYREKLPNVTRFPAVKGLFYDDYMTSVFFPPEALMRVRRKHLEVIHFHTPSQIGLLGAYYAIRNHIPLISTYHTDLYEYVSHYPQVLPGTIALSLMGPLIVKGGLNDFRMAISSIRPERSLEQWNKKIVIRGVTMMHNNCDYVIAPSRKIERQLRSWGTTAPIRILPTGVDRITTTPRQISINRSKYGILPHEKVILFVGRLGSEKNVDLLLSAFQIVQKSMDDVKLVIVGRHEYGKTLEANAHKLGILDKTIFTGYIENDKLGGIYEGADVFAFPSMTDTQALVLHEAAAAGLPIVMIDKDITEVVKHGVNGYFTRNTARDFAKRILQVLRDDAGRGGMAAAGQDLATQYSAAIQAERLESLYQNAIDARARAKILPSK